MIENDTVKLLRECDAGVEMGVASISDVLDNVKSSELRQKLEKCKSDHEALGTDIDTLLDTYHDGGKSPNPIAKGMSWMKTNVRLAAENNDKTVAELMTDGCNMGIKSLCRYLNQYEAADEKSKNIAKKLIGIESGLVSDMREYL